MRRNKIIPHAIERSDLQHIIDEQQLGYNQHHVNMQQEQVSNNAMNSISRED